MERIYIENVKDYADQEVSLAGFVDNYRDGKAMAFMVLKDITGRVQVTIEKELHPDWEEMLSQITPDSVVRVTGKVVLSDFVKLNGVEIIPSAIKIESIAAALPIAREFIPATKKKAAVERSSIDQRIEYRWVDLRTEKNQLMFKAQTALTAALREFALDRDFIEVHTPKLIAAASESGADVFRLDYFPSYNLPNAYLAQSPQFYKQM
ncbi:MAG: aspartate--tRNA(Asn) ligase, partial [Lachnospiraceae bacterium]|nr:aspartate--tRNA(Asn) ligase [Lachnospiraceae bacterium]